MDAEDSAPGGSSVPAGGGGGGGGGDGAAAPSPGPGSGPLGCRCPTVPGADMCGGRCCAARRAELITEYLRQALPPVPSAVLVLPSFAPSGQMVLGCDARLPAVPYGQEDCSGKATSSLAARRRISRLAVSWLRHDQQLQANMMWAVRFNDTDRVKQLISMGADVNEADALGRTPLHVAASQGYSDMVELLLRQGARPDAQDRRRNTPLHLAVCTSRWAVTQKLLAAGASVWNTNGANMSALQLARGKLNMVLRLKVKGTLDFDKHIEELHAVHELVKSALGSSRSMPADAATDPASLASVMDQIENLSISETGNGLSLNDVSAELRQMSLTSGGAAERPGAGSPGPPVCSDVSVMSALGASTAAAGAQKTSDRVSAELRQMSLTSGGDEANSECAVSTPSAPRCS